MQGKHDKYSQTEINSKSDGQILLFFTRTKTVFVVSFCHEFLSLRTLAGGGIGLAFAGSPASMLMAKTAISPKFTGMQKDWVNFRRDWEHYVQLLGGRREISNSILLCTLGETLDEGNRLNLQRMVEEGEVTTYEEYWQKLVQEYGHKQGVGNRQAWEMMRLTVDGVLTSQEFKCFWEKFLRMWKAVPDASEAEAHRLLLGCLPPSERGENGGRNQKNSWATKTSDVDGMAC